VCSAYSVVPKNPVVLETWYWKMGLAGSYPLASFNATSQIG
jgi:hypothetical protein